MGLVPLLQEPQLNEEQRSLRHQFLDATGYGPSDLLSLNYRTKTFLTRNGGEYRILEDGSIKHLRGPAALTEDRE